MDGVVFKCMVILSEVSRLSLVGLILDSWHLHVVFITARKRSLREGYAFTPVCDSVNRGGGACMSHDQQECIPVGCVPPAH